MTAEERLALIQVKVERAYKHIADLDAAIKAFFASKPYEVRTKRNPQTRQLIYYLSRVEAVPNSFAAITGDVVQNLRSALDHLAQQLWLVNNPGAVSTGDVYFPTDSSPSQFKANAPGKVKGLRQDAIDAIYRIEPYDGGKGADLSVINRLNRIDKHRLMIAVYSQLQSFNVGAHMIEHLKAILPNYLPGKVTALPKMDIYLRPADKRALKVGSELLIDGADAEENKDMDFRLNVSLYEPGVIEGKPLLESVQQFADLVGGTVTSFKPCLA
jgi:hypothetical protein